MESLRYKQRRSTKLRRGNRQRKKSSKDKTSVSSGSSDQRKGSAVSADEQDLDGRADKTTSRGSSLDTDTRPEQLEKGDEGFHAVTGGKKGKKGKKGKLKARNKKRERDDEERRVQQLFGAGHQQTARDALSLSVSTPDGIDNPGVDGGLTCDQSSDSLPARLLAHYKRAFPVWQAADYHFRHDGRGLTLSTLNGAKLACHCGKGIEPANGDSSHGANTDPPSSSQQPSASSSTAAAVGTSARQQCRRCSLAAAKRAGLLPSNNNGSLDGGSAAAAAADDDGGGTGGAGDNGAAASGASGDTGKRVANIDAIANFLVLVGLYNVVICVYVCPLARVFSTPDLLRVLY